MDIDTIDSMEEGGDVDGLIAALNPREDMITGYAVEALGRLADPRSVDALVSLLGKSDYFQRHGRSLGTGTGQYQGSVIEALESIGAPAVPKLLAEFQSNKSARELVAQILGRIRDPQAVEVLSQYLSDAQNAILDAPNVPFLVTEALANIGHPSCVAPLLRVLTEVPLGSKLSHVVTEGLDKAGWDPQSEIHQVYYWIMKGQLENCVKMGSTAVAYLLSALERAGTSERIGIIEALGEIRDERAVDALIEQRNKETSHPDAVDAINDALVKIGKRIV